MAQQIVHGGVESCQECTQGKCRNCTGVTWDNDADAEVPCPCAQLTGHGAQR